MKYIIGSCPRHCVHSHGLTGDGGVWGGLSFGSSPVIHSTKKAAYEEADRLSLKYPEKAFVVFQAVVAKYLPSPAIRTEEF